MAHVFKLTTEVFANPTRIWEILATPKGLAHWFSDAVAIEERTGGSFRFRGNFVVGWKEGREFSCPISMYAPGREFGFEFPLHLPDDSMINGTVAFGLEAAGSHTSLAVTHTLDRLPEEEPYLLKDIWAYYGNVITNTCEHDFSEPGLLFDFSRSWKGNFKHVIYINSTPDRVFDALSKPDVLARCFTAVKLFEPRANGRIDFGWTRGPTTVLIWDPPFELAYDWPVEQGGDVHVGQAKWTLEPEGRATRVELRVAGFGPEVDHARVGDALGWAVVLLDTKRFLESGRPALYPAGRYES